MILLWNFLISINEFLLNWSTRGNNRFAGFHFEDIKKVVDVTRDRWKCDWITMMLYVYWRTWSEFACFLDWNNLWNSTHDLMNNLWLTEAKNVVYINYDEQVWLLISPNVAFWTHLNQVSFIEDINTWSCQALGEVRRPYRDFFNCQTTEESSEAYS